MGIFDACLSCLCGRRDDVENHGDTSRLLPENAYGSSGYGSLVNGHRPSVFQPDSDAMRREREALDGICHSMSDNVQDLFLSKSHSNGFHHNTENSSDSNKSNSNHQNSNNGNPTLRTRTSDLGQSGSQEVALRTIRKGRSGPISNALRKQSEGLLAVQDAIG